MVKGDTHMPDFAAIAGLLGNIKSVFDFVAGTTGSISGWNGEKGTGTLLEALFSGSGAGGAESA